MTDLANHPLRDKAMSDAIKRDSDMLRSRRAEVDHLVEHAVQNDATAHANLYAAVCAELHAAQKSAEHAARLMDPNLTNVEDYEEDLT